MAHTPTTTPAPLPDSPDERNTHRCAERCQERLVALRSDSERLSAPELNEAEREAIEADLAPLEIQARCQLKLLLSWGGPSDGFVLTFDRSGELLDGVYFHADWFTYAEEPLSRDDADLVFDLYLHGDASAYFSTVA